VRWRLLWNRRWPWSVAACIFPALVALLSARPVAADEALPLRLCVDPDNLPFSSTSTTTPGFYVELGREIAGTLGRPFLPVWVPTYYTKRQIRLKLLVGQCDGFVGVPDDPSFMGPRLIFSKPIVQLGYALVAPPGMAINTPQDLRGRRVAVQFSTPPQDLLAGATDVQTVTVLSPEEAVQDLEQGKADAAFIWGASAGWLNSSTLHGAYRVVPFPGDHMQWSAAIAFPKDRSELRDQVDHALSGLGATIDRLTAKYDFPVPAPVSVPVNAEAANTVAPNASLPKAGAPDAGAPDARAPDAAAPNASAPNAGPPNAGAPNVGAPSAGAPNATAANSEARAAPAGGDDTQSQTTPAGFAPAPPTAQNIAAGHKLFNEICSHCHGPDAVQGEQRRNLRLLRQRYGDEMPQTFITTVTHGRVNKGMPNWSGIISTDEFSKILAFLTSVQEPGS
jgi:polar amino acid transport system substrate-binding protein